MNNSIKEKAIRLIHDNLGEVSARAYTSYYEGKSDELVLISIKELLIEVLGEQKAQQALAGLMQNEK